MNTKILMATTAFFLGISGAAAQFLPQEIAVALGFNSNPFSVLLIQIIGAMYIGFAMLNWMSREKIIGGVYNKPIAMANFLHFTIGAISLIRVVTKSGSLPFILLLVAYLLFSAIFTYVMFTHPLKGSN